MDFICYGSCDSVGPGLEFWGLKAKQCEHNQDEDAANLLLRILHDAILVTWMTLKSARIQKYSEFI